MNVRRAEIHDIDQVVSLFDAYRQSYGQASDVDGARRFLTERFQRGDSVILLAGDSGVCIGFTQLFPSLSSVSMRRVWILNDLFVAPKHRRRGIASRLIQAAVEFACNDSAARLDLATANGNVAAIALYESLGWKRDAEFTHYKYMF
jgi:ribosomal protein S18 acetylase RimI-like enzyme